MSFVGICFVVYSIWESYYGVLIVGVFLWCKTHCEFLLCILCRGLFVLWKSFCGGPFSGRRFVVHLSLISLCDVRPAKEFSFCGSLFLATLLLWGTFCGSLLAKCMCARVCVRACVCTCVCVCVCVCTRAGGGGREAGRGEVVEALYEGRLFLDSLQRSYIVVHTLRVYFSFCLYMLHYACSLRSVTLLPVKSHEYRLQVITHAPIPTHPSTHTHTHTQIYTQTHTRAGGGNRSPLWYTHCGCISVSVCICYITRAL